ncbi:PTS mannitol transporter subunit IICB [Hafnia alvei]|uniref:PTS mannitol transporter subunit IICB n=1 Tax=Hafnia alvei TaxID=569 RepID=UPI00345D811B
MTERSLRARVQYFGGFLTAMVIPNIGAFIAWGFITALFIPTGWVPNVHFGAMVDPMITYLLPLLIGYTGGQLIGGKRGGVMGAIGTMGVIIGASIPMFIGAMVLGPLGGWIIREFDKRIEGRIPAGFEMVVNNFSLGILGMILALLAYEIIGPAVMYANNVVKSGIEALVSTGFLPLLSVINEPAKVLFLNNAIDQGVYYPLGMQDTAKTGKSIYFMVASNPGPGLGMLLAFALFGKGMSKRSAPGAMIIHFLGGIHELYFPYVLMKPLMILAMIGGGMCGIFVFDLMNAGLVAGPSPGSIFAYLALTPRGGFMATCAGVLAGTVASFLIASLILKLERKVEEDEDFTVSQQVLQQMKQEGKAGEHVSAPAADNTIHFIAFACDAGMGSSAMGATTFRKRIEKAGLDIIVKHFSIENVPPDADLVVVHSSLEDRAKMIVKQPLLVIKNYLGDVKLDRLLDDLTHSKRDISPLLQPE